MERVFAAPDPALALIGVMANAPRDAGRRGVLLVPPSYVKGVGDDGLYAWFARTIDAMRAPRGVILYPILSVTAVALSIALIDRLKRACPGVVTGIKDSAGDWPTTQALLAAHADLHILVGDERLLRYPVTPAIKAIVAHRARDPEFLRCAPPLDAVPSEVAGELVAANATLA